MNSTFRKSDINLLSVLIVANNQPEMVNLTSQIILDLCDLVKTFGEDEGTGIKCIKIPERFPIRISYSEQSGYFQLCVVTPGHEQSDEVKLIYCQKGMVGWSNTVTLPQALEFMRIFDELAFSKGWINPQTNQRIQQNLVMDEAHRLAKSKEIAHSKFLNDLLFTVIMIPENELDLESIGTLIANEAGFQSLHIAHDKLSESEFSSLLEKFDQKMKNMQN